MIGDDWPMPGRSVFQTMLSADHFTGRSVSAEWPSCCGPRQRGQLASAADVVPSDDENASATIPTQGSSETSKRSFPGRSRRAKVRDYLAV